MNENKLWWKSKTLWFNILGAAGMMFGPTGTLGHVFAADEVAAGMGIGNIALRLMTNKGLVK